MDSDRYKAMILKKIRNLDRAERQIPSVMRALNGLDTAGIKMTGSAIRDALKARRIKPYPGGEWTRNNVFDRIFIHQTMKTPRIKKDLNGEPTGLATSTIETATAYGLAMARSQGSWDNAAAQARLVKLKDFLDTNLAKHLSDFSSPDLLTSIEKMGAVLDSRAEEIQRQMTSGRTFE